MTDMSSPEFRPNYNELSIGQARKLASEMGVHFEKTAKLEEMRRRLQDVADGIVRPEAFTPENFDYMDPRYVPPAGMSVVTLHKTAASRKHKLVGVNGYMTLVPRGKVCLIPNSVVEVIQNSTEPTVMEDETKKANDPERFIVEDVQSDPITVHKSSPGEPHARYLGGAPQARKMLAPKKRFHTKFGFWPDAKALKDAIVRGLISDADPVNPKN